MKLSSRIEKLTPPEISPDTIKLMIHGTRPVRQDRFNISSEKFLDKTIINCYGHGGSGWTTLFASVNKAIELFEKLPCEKKKQEIRVIGAGCMGLVMAVELARRGYSVIGITAKELYDLPSWTAAAYFALVSVRTSEEEKVFHDNLGIETFQVYQEIEKGNHPYISKDTLRYMPVYCSKDSTAGVEGLEERGLIPKKEEVILDFGNVQHSGFFKFMSYFMDTSKIMKQIHEEIQRLQIPIEIMEIFSFAEISEDVVFNCSGYGAKDLNHDESMVAVRGHLVLLDENAGTEHMNYMIFSKFSMDDKDETVCLFPKKRHVSSENVEGVHCNGTIGVTYVSNTDLLSPKELKQLDDKEYAKILDRNCYFFYGMSFLEKNATKPFVHLGRLQDLFLPLRNADASPS